jgi:ribosomal protein S19E (S16A)
MSPSEYEYLFILDALERKEPIFPFIVTALKESGLVDVSEQGISLTAAGESLMHSISEDQHSDEHAANDDAGHRQ